MKDKLSKTDIEGVIKDISYYRVPFSTMTICILLLTNGTTVIGESACIAEANFNEAFGKQAAYDSAFSKIWQLEGYLLKEKLFRLNEPLSWPEPNSALATTFKPLGPVGPVPIIPTIGRVVLYHGPRTSMDDKVTWPALVCWIHDERMINVGGFDHMGDPFKDTGVPLLQPGDVLTDVMLRRGYCEWMPYQQAQAAKQAEAENVRDEVAQAMLPPAAK